MLVVEEDEEEEGASSAASAVPVVCEAEEDALLEEVEEIVAFLVTETFSGFNTEQKSPAGNGMQEILVANESSYAAARHNLNAKKKSRGFSFQTQGVAFGDGPQSRLEALKADSACTACGERGHWAGDPECKESRSRLKPKVVSAPAGKARGAGRGTGASQKALRFA